MCEGNSFFLMNKACCFVIFVFRNVILPGDLLLSSAHLLFIQCLFFQMLCPGSTASSLSVIRVTHIMQWRKKRASETFKKLLKRSIGANPASVSEHTYQQTLISLQQALLENTSWYIPVKVTPEKTKVLNSNDGL